MKRKARSRGKGRMPIMLLWSKRDHLRFCEAVERFQALVNDLETILAPAKRKRAMKQAAAILASQATAASAGAAQAAADVDGRAP
jgi:hypothetical protein